MSDKSKDKQLRQRLKKFGRLNAATCDVCGGKRFVRAAPLSVAPTHRYGMPQIGNAKGLHRKALWARAVIVPCWRCATRPI